MTKEKQFNKNKVVLIEFLDRLANWLPLGYAFSAGMVSAVNPCGFLLLPAYVTLYLGIKEEPSRLLKELRAISLASGVVLGFIALFLSAGLVLSLGGQSLLKAVPGAGLAIGVVFSGLGIWLLLGRGYIGISLAQSLKISFRRNWGFAFLFGIVYGLASLSCTLPVFLAVLGSALAVQGMWGAFKQFLSYSLGMGFIVGVVIAGTAFFEERLNRYFRWLMPYVYKLSALFLIGAGAYLVFHWIKYIAFLWS